MENSEEKKNERDKEPTEKPRSSPNCLARLFICWICPVLFAGNQRDIEEEDLIRPNKKYDSEELGDYLESYWLKEVEEANRTNRKPSLWKTTVRAFWVTFLPGGILQLITAVTSTLQPLLFTQLLSYWTVDTTLGRLEAGYYALGMVGLKFINMMSTHHNNLFVMTFSLKMKVACSALLYRKILRVSQVAAGEVAAGKLVNLLSNDLTRFDYGFMFLHQLWIIPLQSSVVLYLLYNAAGYAPFVGLFGVVIIMLPLQAVLTKLSAVIRRETAKRTDSRIKLMSEIINGIQVIKMYAWEKPFRIVVKAARAFEMKSLKKSIFVRSTFLGFMTFTERSILFLTCLTLILSGTMVTATTIYPIQQYFSIIQFSLTMMLPFAIAGLSEMMVSFERIEGFLLLEEKEDKSITDGYMDSNVLLTFNGKNNSTERKEVLAKKYSPNEAEINLSRDLVVSAPPKPSAAEYAIEISGVDASWTKDLSNLTLKNLSMRIRKGKLCAVIGPVGAGKSSLLQVLLKELPIIKGKFSINGTVSYACQESWLFPATVRENILFGLPYIPHKYKEVCRVCSLLPDFKQFPYGDLTLVGERGVSLSGGQRARINLARSVYRDADIYLLDDPLSAVDANVGRQLFEGCINGYLKGSTCILITHQIHFLKAADLIVVLNDGAIENMGTYSELSKSDSEFTVMLKNLQENAEGDDTGGNKITKRPSLHRGVSKTSVKSEENPEEQVAQVQEAEERQKGALKWSVVYKYLSIIQSWFMIILTLVALLLTQGAGTTTDYWLSFWTNQVAAHEQSLEEGEVLDTNLDTQVGILTTGQYLIVYGSLIVAIIVILHLRIAAFVETTMRASKNFHDLIFKNLIVAVMRFFDTNQSGRVLNRFSKDMGALDELLPRSMLETIQMYLSMTSILVLNALALPWTLIPTFLLVVVFTFLLKWYLNAAQAVKRLEGTTKSPVFSMINSTISGLSTVRSSNAENRLSTMFDQTQNLHSSAFYTFTGGSAAFGLCLDSLCLIYFGTVLAIFILIDFADAAIPVGSVGLAVSQSMVLTMMLQMAARFTADFLAQMTAVERVLEYTRLPTEEFMEEGPTKPSDQWPSAGHISFRNVYLQYAPEEPPVLKDLNFEILTGWKVGIVGRTGAGKSSLISALFRLSPIEGSIKIDGIDTHGIAKQKLRSKISIIPQEPVLFSASLRYNLDPFEEYADDMIWRALEQVELKEAVPALDFKVSEGGSNFSVGQRQLVCLARAILRSNKILVMDEATANVDPQTDALIQKTIRREFASCTVLTIAHRLNTIMDSDRVLVMDKGQVAEFDHPYNLLSNPNSMLSFMVKETGESMSKQLFEMSKTKYFTDNPNKKE